MMTVCVPDRHCPICDRTLAALTINITGFDS